MPDIPAGTKEEALRLHAEGVSFREIGRRLGIAAMTVSRWAAKEKPVTTIAERIAARAPAPELADEPPPAPAGPVTPESVLELIQEILADTRAIIRAAKLSGNHTAAQRATRDLGNLTSQLIRAQKAIRDGNDTIRVTPEEYHAAERRIVERVAAIQSRGALRCASCARELSIDLAGARAKIEESEKARATKAK